MSWLEVLLLGLLCLSVGVNLGLSDWLPLGKPVSREPESPDTFGAVVRMAAASQAAQARMDEMVEEEEAKLDPHRHWDR